VLTYGWTQTGGTAVTFTPDLSVTTFTAPATSAVLTFTLMVTDTGGLTGTDTVVVTVANLADLSVTENVVHPLLLFLGLPEESDGIEQSNDAG
jgi:hypothetical protein